MTDCLRYPPDLGRVGNGAAFAVCYLFELGIYCVGGSLIMEQVFIYFSSQSFIMCQDV